jgi:hypothetical protein
MEPEDESTRKREAIKRIAEANAELATLQRARYETLMRRCLPAYDQLGERGGVDSKFAIDPLLFRLASPDFDATQFSDQVSAIELERAADSLSSQLRVHRKRVERQFDVFLSYNSEDRGEVRTVARYLESAGLLPWFDRSELRPGDNWLTRLQQDIAQISSCAVIVGRTGIGPWQQQEVAGALQLFVERRLRIVPVLLPSCGAAPELPLFLRSVGWVDFRQLDPDPIEQLVRSIERHDA